MSNDAFYYKKMEEYIKIINSKLHEYFNVPELPQKIVYEAMQYSINAGGKRIRPVLSLAVCDLLNYDVYEILPFACAVELIHTYSLIHDDLPCMDNDDYRRGKPTNHKVYGEAMAVLAGDGLLNLAFEIINEELLKCQELELLKRKIKAACIISKASGCRGMIGGQAIDITSEGKDISEELLMHLHNCKTGALIKASVISSGIVCGARETELNALDKYSQCIGLAFQIKDDILDYEGEMQTLGKTPGKDIISGKATFVSLMGLDRAKSKLDELMLESVKALACFGEKADFLKFISDVICSRIF